MKHFSTILLCTVIISLLAFKQTDQIANGSVGDVKYSVLPPDKFIEENGLGWVLMDDRINLTESTLSTKHGISSLPDARGMFIRGLNLTRSDQMADPFYKETQRARRVGELQDDTFEQHNHGLKFTSEEHGTCQGVLPRFTNRGCTGNANWTYMGGTQGQGGSETRPQNIALYIYVKIK